MREISTTVAYLYAFPRCKIYGERLSNWRRHSVNRVLRKIAEPIGRTKPHGAILWRLKVKDPAGKLP
jgi:hypothetical protein